jgi:hypothetical protein
VKEGQLHVFGCDSEYCPFCGHQLLYCDCVYEKLGIDCWPEGTSVVHGLTKEQIIREWERLLQEKGRIPFILYPYLCARCGALWPEMFHVPDDEWQRYVEPAMRDKMLCETCFTQIKSWIDEAQKRP